MKKVVVGCLVLLSGMYVQAFGGAEVASAPAQSSSVVKSVNLTQPVSASPVVSSVASSNVVSASGALVVGTVDLQAVVSKSSACKQAEAGFVKKIEAKAKEGEKITEKLRLLSETFKKNSPTMKESERQAELAKLKAADAELQKKRSAIQQEAQQAQRTLQSMLRIATAKVAAQEKIDMVVPSEISLYNSSKVIDLTSKVIQQLDGGSKLSAN